MCGNTHLPKNKTELKRWPGWYDRNQLVIIKRNFFLRLKDVELQRLSLFKSFRTYPQIVKPPCKVINGLVGLQ